MALGKTPQVALRIARLQALVDEKFGSDKASTGRALGFKDGAYVGQMLRSERPITEKLIAKIEAMRGLSGWFAGATLAGAGHAAATGTASLTPGPSVGSDSDSLTSAVETIARHMRSADAMTREAVAPFLAKIAYAPNDVGRITRMIESMIAAHPDQAPTSVKAESPADTDVPRVAFAPLTGAQQDAVVDKLMVIRDRRATDKTPSTIKRVERRATGGVK